jgi:hypothetical protein
VVGHRVLASSGRPACGGTRSFVLQASLKKVAYVTGQRLPALLLSDILRTALAQIRANLLRSIFTLLGIIVSVAFLVAVVAVIQGMNSYVSDNLANAMVGSNSFQVRRTPRRRPSRCSRAGRRRALT